MNSNNNQVSFMKLNKIKNEFSFRHNIRKGIFILKMTLGHLQFIRQQNDSNTNPIGRYI